MIRLNGITLFIAFFLCGCATAPLAVIDDPQFNKITAKSMVRFQSESEFRQYIREAKRVTNKRGGWWASTPFYQLAQAECTDPSCLGEEEVVVTGSRAPSSSSITNTQNVGVDEGDIVKQYKNFLIVLQDGRLLVADTGKSSSDLKLVDRMNVYRDKNFDSWYDELLVFENMLLVTAYSYDAEATELAVFKISDAGKLSRQGTFYTSSNDYYDTDNYASRLVKDKLVIYTPYDLTEFDPKEEVSWPVIRRWINQEEKIQSLEHGRSIFKARDIYYPIQKTIEPVLHTITICPLGEASEEHSIDCDTKAIIGPKRSEYYVSKDNAFIWSSSTYDDIEVEDELDDCDLDQPASFKEARPGALFKFPLSGKGVEAIHVRGMPTDQFSMESSENHFMTLARWDNPICENDRDAADFMFFKTSLSSFSTRPRAASSKKYVTVPSLPFTSGIENRFTDEYVVYAGRKRRGTFARKKKADDPQRQAVAVPVNNASAAVEMPIMHDVIRAERAGDNIVLTGHEYNSGLNISLAKLDKGEPHISDNLFIEDRYESEGRSHAFNSDIQTDGSGIMGLPTTRRVQQSGRHWWRSIGSDVSFMSVSSDGKIGNKGFIAGNENSEHSDYKCEVSCVDWYGNTRPIFFDGRVFALIGAELVEVSKHSTTIRELARINLSAPFDGDVQSEKISEAISKPNTTLSP